MGRCRLGLMLSFVGSTTLYASPFTLPTETSPRSLHMRAPAWRVAAAAVTDSPEQESSSIFSRADADELELGPGELDRLPGRVQSLNALPPRQRLSENIVFRFNLGVGLDSGETSGAPLLSGERLSRSSFEKMRIYSFGDAAIGTHDLGFSGLNTYLAAHFQRNQNSPTKSSALPSVYDGNFQQPLIRSAYGEADRFFFHPLLRPIHVRAGRSFQYGLSAIHFDGVTVGYDTPALKISFYGGQRVNLYTFSASRLRDSGALSGTNIRVDLFEWRKWPLVLFANSLNFDDHSHFRTGVALRWNQDMLLSGSLRYLDGTIARSTFSLRARLSDVTTLNFAVHNRSQSDWSFGLLQFATPDNSTDSRRYLDLGPVLPKTTMSGRYGTVLLRNLDLLVHASGAFDRRDDETDAASSFNASYFEAGGGLEVHARRSLRLGIAVSARRYFLQEAGPISRVMDNADPLPRTLGATGVSSFLEGGMNFVYSPGAREFSASAEIYGRRYRYQSEYLDSDHQDWRSGGRFSIEGWTFDRFRIKSEYDVSFGDFSFAPELGGLKSLRILLEGSF
ncbi:MAG: hypothetical protein JKY56_01965 [Kofleriaceae bacterium]|nr:hypothetical protein [Kofleriaceae bacterium]